MTTRRSTTSLATVGVAVTALLLGGCSSSSTNEPVTVSVFFHSGQGTEREAFDELVRDWNASSATQVLVDVVPEGDYDAQVVAAAEDGRLPCLLDVDGPFLQPYVSAGYLRPLADLADASLLDDLLPSVLEQGTAQDGELYGIGVFDSGLALWGNRDQLERAGVRIPTSVQDAWDFDEFNAAIDALQDLPDVEHALDLKVNYGAGEWFTYGFTPFVWGFGGDLVDTSSGATIAAGSMDGGATVAALDWLAGLVADGHVDADQTTDDDFYVSRTSAVSWVGHWMWEAHRDGLGDDLVLLPVPAFPAAQVTGQGSWQWGITSSCEHPEAAWDFLASLLEPDAMLRMTEANGAVPSRSSVIAASELYGPGAPLDVFAEQLAAGVGRPRPITSDYRSVTASFSTAVADVLAGVDPEMALADAAERIDAG